jgi:hypothetical protein
LKKSNNIQSVFTAFLAVMLLFVSTFSNVLAHNNKKSDSALHSKAQKANNKSNNEDKAVFNKTSIEAVFSQIVPAFTFESVVFQAVYFNFSPNEIVFKVISSFANQYHLEILFEHLIAPNAP